MLNKQQLLYNFIISSNTIISLKSDIWRSYFFQHKFEYKRVLFTRKKFNKTPADFLK
jgi:hypothetical protein